MARTALVPPASLVLLVTSQALAPPAPFVQDAAPQLATSSDNTYLLSIKAGPGGRLAAVGRRYTTMVGGAHKDLLVLEKAGAGGAWAETPAPHLGISPLVYQELNGVDFVGGNLDGDFVAVGEYQPDVSSAIPSVGVVLRYHRSAQSWDVHDITVPGHMLVHISDVAVDPSDGNRFLIAGLTANNASPDADYEPLLAEYRADTGALVLLDVPVISPLYSDELYSISPRPGGGFIAAGTSWLIAGYIEGMPLFLEIDADNDVTQLAGPPNLPQPDYSYIYDAAVYADGRILAVGTYYEVSDPTLPLYCYGTLYQPATQQWTFLNTLNPAPVVPNGSKTNQLFGVTIGPGGKAYAVGRIIVHRPEVPSYFYETLLQSFNGTNWKLEQTPATYFVDPDLQPFALGFGPQLFDVAVHPSGQVFAAGWFQTKATLIPAYFNTALVLRRGLVFAPPHVQHVLPR